MRVKKRRSGVPDFMRGKVLAFAVASCFAGGSIANPNAPTVLSGNATFQSLGKTLNITNTPGAVIQWNGFSINSDEITRFIQQNASSSVLNRVVGGEASNLLGQLLSNGKVFLINPNGVFIGGGAIIDTAGFVASSLRLSDADFLSGKFKFEEQIGAAKIVNQGTINANGGPVYLVAPNVENHGVITSPTGEIILAAGKSVELVQAANPNLRVEITAGESEALNVGKLVASSGRVGIFGTTVRNSGTVSANAASVDAATGKIVFRAKKDVTLDATSVVTANGAKGGEVTVVAGDKNAGGTLLADGVVEVKGSVAKGGTVQMLGDRVGLIGNAKVDASGDAGGGTVLVGGDFQGKNAEVQNAFRTVVDTNAIISANAGNSGDGGKVIIWSDHTTRYAGSITARGGVGSGNGGFAEVSGKEYLAFSGRADLRAPHGQTGSLLLDPTNILVAAASEAGVTITQVDQFGDANVDNGGGGADATTNTIAAGAIVTALDSAAVTLQATNDIDVNSAIDASGNSGNFGLTMQAGNNINVGAAITTKNGITLSANDSGGTPTGNGRVSTTAVIDSGVGAVSLNNNGSATAHSLGANVTGVGITITGAATLTAAVTLNSGSGGTTTGAVSGAQALTLQGSGTDSIASVNVASVNVDKTGGAATFTGNVVTSGNFDTQNGNFAVSLNGSANAVGGAGAFLNDSNLTIGASGGTSSFATGLTTTGAAGTNTLNGTINTTDTAMTLGAVTLGSAVTLNTNATTTAGDLSVGA
ncbi:MAG: filamentous hemagglutinin N-terminal domain-containing protein, partial [Burkholderiales bacterium]